MTRSAICRIAAALGASLVVTNANTSYAFEVDLKHAISNLDAEQCANPTLAPEIVFKDCFLFVRMFGNDEYYRPQLAQILFFLGTAYVRKGQTEAATKSFGLALNAVELALLQRSHSESWDTSQGRNNQCWIKAVSGIQLSSALSDCDEALKLKPNNPDTLDARAFVFYRQGHFRDALAAYDTALNAKSDDAPALFMRGVTKFQLGDEQGGDADVRSARTKNSDIDALYAGYGLSIK